MTAEKALSAVVGSRAYRRLRFIIARTGIGEGDTPEKCRQTIGALMRQIKSTIAALREKLPDSERPKFKALLQTEVRKLRALLSSS